MTQKPPFDGGIPMGNQARSHLPHIGIVNADANVWFLDADAFEVMLRDIQERVADARSKPELMELLVVIGSGGYEIRHRIRDPYPPITSEEAH